MKHIPTLPGAEPPKRRKLGQRRVESLVRELAQVVRTAFEAGEIGSLFGLEGPLRAAIRADLCREGWAWKDADDMAREMLDKTFRTVRANRPGWDEGQREWTVHAGTLIERTLCIRCKAPLPEGHHKFCSSLCASAHHHMMDKRKGAAEDAAYDKVVKFNGKKYVA